MNVNSHNAGIPPCFKAYDIRGHVPGDIDGHFAALLGASCAPAFAARKVAIGHDARLSSPMLAAALGEGLRSAGIAVTDLGLCGTEEIYYAAANGDFDLGIMITGSHNPADENGFKIVRRGAAPVGLDSGLKTLAGIIAQCRNVETAAASRPGPRADSADMPCSGNQFRAPYIRWLAEYSGVNRGRGRRLRVLADAGNGCAGLVLRDLAEIIPHELIPLNWTPDGSFPNGVPNPLLPDRRSSTARAVVDAGADLGVAFDGDFDRCFFYDAKGGFMEGYYLVGLLAAQLLLNRPGEKIVHDTRVYWNTRQVVKKAGGIPVMGKTGHALMKEKMRLENALYGGEMSAHHYFRDFAYCDSGILAMLLVLAFLQNSEVDLEEALAQPMREFPCSGEINFRASNAPQLMEEVRRKYGKKAVRLDNLDGINIEMPDWRFNLRSSNTEPLLRLNVESRGERGLMQDMTGEISAMLLDGGASAV